MSVDLYFYYYFMAYMDQEKKALLMPEIKKVLAEFGEKASVSVQNYSTLVLSIKEGGMFKKGDYINEYHLKDCGDGRKLEFLQKIKRAMMEGNHDNSDAMTDYFDVGWYITITVK